MAAELDEIRRCVALYDAAPAANYSQLITCLAAEATRRHNSLDPDARAPEPIFPYFGHGLYFFQLQHWFHYFPRSQFLVLRTEDLRDQPEATLNTVTDFLGLARHNWTAVSARRYNVGVVPGQDGTYLLDTDAEAVLPASPLSPEFAARARRIFAPYNTRLARLLGTTQLW
eukprot:TRINITY_DN7496_c0_g1_i1.p5 TRINITY_DN7496_c0_g1~~TRINITY_DN7496_c0_g1_i1.p5  ORF type:complete len:171 (-),score=26.38 TRINITY_DN7496_c0_g1_i1:734-1246(-)